MMLTYRFSLVTLICFAVIGAGFLALKNTRMVVEGCGLTLAKESLTYTPALKRCANDENSEAMAWLGLLYWNDIGKPNKQFKHFIVPQGDKSLERQGYKYIQRAAEMGNPIAANELGLAYYQEAYGRPLNMEKALKWLKMADDQGDELASQNLAIIYLNGHGVTSSKEKALGYLERSARRGSVVSLWTMGAYHLSKGTQGDQLIADAYFVKADILGGECSRPSEVCEDFLPLFDDEQMLISANEYVDALSLSSCV